MLTEMTRGLTTTYQTSRRRFLAAANETGADVATHLHPLRGIDGEELAIDVASIGPDDAESVLLIVSGTHGVEGFTGSALQHHWLEQHAAARPAQLRVVLVHALNPYGFAWVRRVNEDNVDLNRNFVDWSQPPPANEDYGALAQLLVPDTWDEDDPADHDAAAPRVRGGGRLRPAPGSGERRASTRTRRVCSTAALDRCGRTDGWSNTWPG